MPATLETILPAPSQPAEVISRVAYTPGPPRCLPATESPPSTIPQQSDSEGLEELAQYAENPSIRAAAVAGLSASHPGLVLAALVDPAPVVRRAAIETLADQEQTFPQARYVEPLVTHLQGEEDPQVMNTLLAYLQRFASSEQLDAAYSDLFSRQWLPAEIFADYIEQQQEAGIEVEEIASRLVTSPGFQSLVPELQQPLWETLYPESQ